MKARGRTLTIVYDQLAEFYDWEHSDFRDDLPLYLGFARASSGPLLDAACGTGRILLPLAEAGYTVTGVDSSAGMLSSCRAKLAQAGLEDKAPVVQADLRTMELGRRFGMALVGLGSFQHLTSLREQKSALERLAAHLPRGGLLIVDLVNPTPEWLAAGDGTLVHQLSGPFPDQKGPDWMSKMVARTTSFGSQMDHSLLIYDRTNPDGVVTRRVFPMDTRFLFRYEAELLLDVSGFRLRELYGDYDLEGYGDSSPRMIVVAERR